MPYEFHLAADPGEIEAIQALRYDVYVEEMGRYRASADHERRLLVEPEDEHSFLGYATCDGAVVAANRLTWGRHGFSDRQRTQYELDPFLADIPVEHLAVGERAMVRPEHRGSDVMIELMLSGESLIADHDIRMIFAACEPHLLSLYVGQGQQPYAQRNINSDEAGYLIPIVGFRPGLEAMQGVGSATEGALPDSLAGFAAGSLGAVRPKSLTAPDDYLGDIHRSLADLELSAFAGLDADETERCIGRSNIIECAAGDRLLKKGGSARNLFVVLEGTLEARDGGRPVGTLGEGDVFGELAFLLERPRTVDVYAVEPVRVLSLSERTMRSMIADDPVVAAKVLMNVAKMLCVRLIEAN